MKCDTALIQKNIDKIDPVQSEGEQYYAAKHGATVLYYKKVIKNNSYKKRINKSIIKDIVNIEESYN